MALAFSATTVRTIVVCVAALARGLALGRLGRLERWATAIAGAAFVLCGADSEFLGL